MNDRHYGLSLSRLTVPALFRQGEAAAAIIIASSFNLRLWSSPLEVVSCQPRGFRRLDLLPPAGTLLSRCLAWALPGHPALSSHLGLHRDHSHWPFSFRFRLPISFYLFLLFISLHRLIVILIPFLCYLASATYIYVSASDLGLLHRYDDLSIYLSIYLSIHPSQHLATSLMYN